MQQRNLAVHIKRHLGQKVSSTWVEIYFLLQSFRITCVKYVAPHLLRPREQRSANTTPAGGQRGSWRLEIDFTETQRSANTKKHKETQRNTKKHKEAQRNTKKCKHNSGGGTKGLLETGDRFY